ncbi:hypothetical protein GCM10010862_45000 [Devosia nitrariae]|uniref:Uncharacterized protein n=1 Tax=Devosia nitrariae TaxID=2071872 RepID=A0ABQ5WCB0_9HYPH|nr:hypothetical protein GCM10010862_45000 [Devosia nitrariae]
MRAEALVTQGVDDRLGTRAHVLNQFERNRAGTPPQNIGRLRAKNGKSGSDTVAGSHQQARRFQPRQVGMRHAPDRDTRQGREQETAMRAHLGVRRHARTEAKAVKAPIRQIVRCLHAATILTGTAGASLRGTLGGGA